MKAGDDALLALPAVLFDDLPIPAETRAFSATRCTTCSSHLDEARSASSRARLARTNRPRCS
jgi:hypothetical protein